MKKIISYLFSLSLTVGLIGLAHGTADKTMPVIKSSTELSQLKNLAGKWEGPNTMDKDGGKITVEYNVISNGSAVEEKLFPDTPQSMVSICYDKDGKLMMTHYCAMGNRPEMALKSAAKNQINLDYVPTAGIDAAKDCFMRSLSLSFPDSDHLTQTWSSYNNGREQSTSVFNLTRVK